MAPYDIEAASTDRIVVHHFRYTANKLNEVMLYHCIFHAPS